MLWKKRFLENLTTWGELPKGSEKNYTAKGENAMENNHLCSCPGGLEKETSLEKRTQKIPVWKSESCWIVKPPTFSVDLFMTSGDMSATRLIAQALLVERQTAPWATSGKDVGIWYMKE